MKTKEEILNQLYVSAQDIKILMPSVSINVCRQYVDLIREEMKQDGLFIPGTKPRLALTKLVKKRLGI